MTTIETDTLNLTEDFKQGQADARKGAAAVSPVDVDQALAYLAGYHGIGRVPSPVSQ